MTFNKRTSKKNECIMPMRCITFDKAAQDALPDHIKAKMKADRVRAEANKTFSDMLKRDLERRNGSMGFRQWIICHKGYEIDGVVVNKGDMHRNESTRPVMNTENWRPATVKEIQEYYKNNLL